MLPLKLNKETMPEMYTEIDYCFIISKDFKLIEITTLQAITKFSAKEEEIDNYIGVIIIDNEGDVYKIDKITYKKSFGLTLYFKESKIELSVFKELLINFINDKEYEEAVIYTEDHRSLLVSYLKKEIIKEIEGVVKLKDLSKKLNKTIYFSYSDCNMSELSDFSYEKGAVLEYPFNIVCALFSAIGFCIGKVLGCIIPSNKKEELIETEYFYEDNIFIRYSECEAYWEEPLFIKKIEKEELSYFQYMFKEGFLYKIEEENITKIKDQEKEFLKLKKEALTEIEETIQDQIIFEDMINKIRNELIEKIKQTKNIKELMFIYTDIK